MSSDGPVIVRLTTPEAEALSDAVPGELSDWWPDDWPDHGEAATAALARVTAVLDGRADTDLAVLFYIADVVDNLVQHAMLERARAADVIAVGGTVLHRLGGCGHARRHDPATASPGQYRRGRLPLFMTEAQGDRWLAASPARRRCKLCPWPG